MRETDLSWLAGIMDGEGSISFPRRGTGVSYRPRVDITSTSLAIITKVLSVLDGLAIHRYTSRRFTSALSRKPATFVSMQGDKSVIPFLRAILPYLTEKRPLAEALVNFYENRPPAWTRWTEADVLAARRIRADFMPKAKLE